ncbi:biopolymer transporter ExbD [Verrucomicrobium sp. BvORR106]|uniref:ExbD/TolR family protein n=1 Tax=Verrucomicrobium sp. BvORR106 TaxID=1403819 RepID=UPI0005713747|nr:biopolymer transporter ExbD [Verrucomicrobium sp. BvORR106]
MNIRRKKRTTPQIPIVALVDILVIVLLFIVATTTFRQQKTQMKINLPTSKALGVNSPSNEKRTTLAITPERKILLDGTEVTADKLAEALAAFRERDPKAKLELQADKETPLGLLVRVWDSLKSAGIPINDVPARIQRGMVAPAASAAATAP